MAKPTDLYPWATDPGATVDPGPAREATGFRSGKKPPAKWFNFLFNGAHQWFQYLSNLPNEAAFLGEVFHWTGGQTHAAPVTFNANVHMSTTLNVQGNVNMDADLDVTGNMTGVGLTLSGDLIVDDVLVNDDLIVTDRVTAADYRYAPNFTRSRYWSAQDGTSDDLTDWAWQAGGITVKAATPAPESFRFHLNGLIPADALISAVHVKFSRTGGSAPSLVFYSTDLFGGDLDTHGSSASIGTGTDQTASIDLSGAPVDFTSFSRLYFLQVEGASDTLFLHAFGASYGQDRVSPP